LFWIQTTWTYLVVLDSDHVELFSCSGIFVAFILQKKHNMVDELIRVLNFYFT